MIQPSTFFRLIVIGISVGLATLSHAQQKEILVVVGAAGESEFGDQFESWAEQWKSIAGDNRQVTLIGLKNQPQDREQLREKLESIANRDEQPELWLVLLGHGTFDGKIAKFNLKGRDFSATELASWLQPIQSRSVIINCSSCSSPFVTKLAAPNRIVVSATKSGYQYNFARFGEHLSQAIADPTIDLDKDGQTSLLEAFIAASANVKEFYDSEGRLATELAIIDDNADGRGTPADWFSGTRAIKSAKDGKTDGLSANQIFLFQRPEGVTLSQEQLEIRNALEVDLAALRKRKADLTEDDYFLRLEEIMLKLAKLYDSAKKGKSSQ